MDINTLLYRPILPGSQYTPYMPPSDCSSRSLGKGDTRAAILQMAATANKYQHHTTRLTRAFFSKLPLATLCQNLHNFLYHHIQYAIDEEAQLLRAPACTWATRHSGVDCKSYSIFASTVLLNAGITHYLRRIRQARQPNGFTHVYVVVPKNQRTASLATGYYTIDGTIPQFAEPPFLEADDVMMRPKKVSAKLQAPMALAANQLFLGEPVKQLTAEQFAQLTAAQAVQYVRATADAIKQQQAAIIEGVSSISQGIASLFGPIGALVGVCIQSLGIIVNLFVMFAYNPCADMRYQPDDIRRALQLRFSPTFVNLTEEIQKYLQAGALVACQDAFNTLLREIDLGIAHYRQELSNIQDQKCDYAALFGFKNFVDAIESLVATLYGGFRAMLKQHYRFDEEVQWGSTSLRSWYFIVPPLHHTMRAPYRQIKISRWNENLRTMYPYGDSRSFLQWLEENTLYLNTAYNDGRGDKYRAQMLPFKSQIEAIRANIHLSPNLRYAQEERLRKEQYQIYLTYDTRYSDSLKKDVRDEVKKVLQRNEEFVSELKKIRLTNLHDERRRLDNIMDIAQSKANANARIKDKELINLIALGTIGLLAIKMINK